MSGTVPVGLGQVRVVMGDKPGNVRRLLEAANEAGRRGCRFLVLPECPLAGWLSPSARRLAERIPGPYTRRLAAAARRHRMAIVSGVDERDGPRLYNSAVLIDASGRLLLRHRKIDELDIGLRLYSRGTELKVARTGGATVGVNICADSWGSAITDSLYLMGTRLLLSPSAWAVEPGGERRNLRWIAATYRKRTRGKRLTVASADSVGEVTAGPWRGRILQGNSLVTGPGGRTLLTGPTNRAAVLVQRVRL